MCNVPGVMPVVYKTVEQGEHRHVIVDQESSGMEMRVTPNLANEQFKIELIMAEACPVKTSCVRIEEGVNSICNYMGSFTSAEDGSVDFTELTGSHCDKSINCGPADMLPGTCTADANHNGEVEVNDFLTLLSEWGPCE